MGEARRRRQRGEAFQEVPRWRDLPPLRVPAALWARLEAERASRGLSVEGFVSELIEVALDGLARARAKAEKKGRLVRLPGEEGQ